VLVCVTNYRKKPYLHEGAGLFELPKVSVLREKTKKEIQVSGFAVFVLQKSGWESPNMIKRHERHTCASFNRHEITGMNKKNGSSASGIVCSGGNTRLEALRWLAYKS
jgi:hypothetical protein